MEMTLAEVKAKHQGLLGISNKNLPAKLAYAVAKNLRMLDREVEIIEKQRVKTAEKYARKDESGRPVVKSGSYSFTADGEGLFKKEYNELLEEKTAVSVRTVPESVFSQMEDPRYDLLTPANMLALDFMVEAENACTAEKTK